MITSGNLNLDTVALIDAEGLMVAGGDGFELVSVSTPRFT